MSFAKLGTAVAAGVLLAAAHAPAFAASVQTNAFLDNLIPNVAFLDQSSRDALTNSKNARLKAFALREARDQTLADNSLGDWVRADKVRLAQAADGVQTGRSVAIDTPTTPVAADNRLPHGQEDLDLLGGLTGRDFDTEFKTRQLDALTQVETDYATYIGVGDDPQLLALANRELPKVRRQLAELRKL